MTTLQEAPEGERLARIEATLDLLVRQGIEIREDMRAMNSDIREDMRESRKEARGYFFWTLGILVPQPLRDDRYRPLLVIPVKAGIHRFKPDCYCQNNMETVLVVCPCNYDG